MNTKILIVDDTPKDVEFLKECLMVWGYEIVCVSSGEEALKVVNDQKVDLVLLDVLLPGIDGFEVLKKLRMDEKTKLLPVLTITSLLKEYRLLAINLGADEFLSKPIDKVELNVRVKSLLRIKSLHDQLEANYKTLEELLKLKDYLSSTITHDINNHLSVIKSFFDFLSVKRATLPDTVKEGLLIAMKASDSLVSLVSDFIDVKKMEDSKLVLHLEDTDANDIIKNVMEETNLLAEDAGVKLTRRDSGQPLLCRVDKKLISRVIINLIINGIKSTPLGGDVEVAASLGEEGLRVSVRDTGIGVPPEYKEKIFEKFAAIDNKGMGSRIGKGLGLTFCKFAVEAHNGKIRVESEGKDKGSAFIFTIPKK